MSNETEETIEARSLTPSEISTIREKAQSIFQALEQPSPPNPPSWVRQTKDDATTTDWLQSRTERCRYFDRHGFLHIPNFVDIHVVESLKKQMEDLANNDWDPSAKDDVASFGTDAKSNLARGDYFLDSSNRVHYFAEQKALLEQKHRNVKDDGSDDHVVIRTVLKEEYQQKKINALNKAGHGMHIIPGAFQDFTLSNTVSDLVTELGWQDPVVPQSMYIFKQPKIGGTVHSHQDSTFLYTTPKQSCLGLWLALDDANLANGCLWVRPGSHSEPLRRQFIRNPEFFRTSFTENVAKEAHPPKLVFDIHDENLQVPWEGGLPKNGKGVSSCESLLGAGFVPVECKAGDLVTFCGQLDHLSLPNYSNLTRHTFQLHLVEGPRVGVSWSPKNWLQYPPGMPFLNLSKESESMHTTRE